MDEKPTRRLSANELVSGGTSHWSVLHGEPGQLAEFRVRPDVLEDILDTLRDWGRLVEPEE